jgi:hypothetical protein
MSGAAPVSPMEISAAWGELAEMHERLRQVEGGGIPLLVITASVVVELARLDARVALPLWNFTTGYSGVFDAAVTH